MNEILQIKNLMKSFKIKNKTVNALNDISFDINKGECLGIVGESGSGDSDIMMTDTINPLKSKFKASTKLLNKTI